MRLWESINTTWAAGAVSSTGLIVRDPGALAEVRLGSEADTDEPLEVAIDSIRIHMATGQQVVILKEKGAERYLPIWIGDVEAKAIAQKITGVETERPMTHDLAVSMLGELGVEIERIVVTSVAHEIFYARVHLVQSGRRYEVDSRPSDAIALAVRTESPIFVASEVLEQAGVVPEAEEGEGQAGTAEADEDRLAVFRALVNSLDLPDLPDEPGAPPQREPGS